MNKVQGIHRFWKSKQVHLAVTISKSYMTWALAVCRIGVLPQICLPLCIKVKSDIENCAVLLLWVFVKLEQSLDFLQTVQAVQLLFCASSDLCTSCFNSNMLSAGSYDMLPWAYQYSAFTFPSFREQCSATHELQSPQVLCSRFSAGDFLQKSVDNFCLRHQLFYCSKVLLFSWKIILVTGYSNTPHLEYMWIAGLIAKLHLLFDETYYNMEVALNANQVNKILKKCKSVRNV